MTFLFKPQSHGMAFPYKKIFKDARVKKVLQHKEHVINVLEIKIKEREADLNQLLLIKVKYENKIKEALKQMDIIQHHKITVAEKINEQNRFKQLLEISIIKYKKIMAEAQNTIAETEALILKFQSYLQNYSQSCELLVAGMNNRSLAKADSFNKIKTAGKNFCELVAQVFSSQTLKQKDPANLQKQQKHIHKIIENLYKELIEERS